MAEPCTVIVTDLAGGTRLFENGCISENGSKIELAAHGYIVIESKD